MIELLSNREPAILDRDIGNIIAPIVAPTPFVPLPPPPPPSPSPTAAVEELLKSLEKVKEIPKSISPELKALKKKIKDIYSNIKQIVINHERSAIKGWAKQYIINGLPVSSPEEFLELTRSSITNILKDNRGIKVKMVLKCNMYRFDEVDTPLPTNFSSEINEINLTGTDVYELYNIMMGRILENITNFQMLGSGWMFHSIIKLEVHTVAYDPLKASGYIPLPDWIKNKKAVISMKTEDNKCFLWCILRALNPKDKHANRVDEVLKSKEIV